MCAAHVTVHNGLRGSHTQSIKGAPFSPFCFARLHREGRPYKGVWRGVARRGAAWRGAARRGATGWGGRVMCACASEGPISIPRAERVDDHTRQCAQPRAGCPAAPGTASTRSGLMADGLRRADCCLGLRTIARRGRHRRTKRRDRAEMPPSARMAHLPHPRRSHGAR